jgi:hypothetical protein
MSSIQKSPRLLRYTSIEISELSFRIVIECADIPHEKERNICFGRSITYEKVKNKVRFIEYRIECTTCRRNIDGVAT